MTVIAILVQREKKKVLTKFFFTRKLQKREFGCPRLEQDNFRTSLQSVLGTQLKRDIKIAPQIIRQFDNSIGRF